MIARHLRITGTVQGVWYRDSTVREAQALGLTGWVRNRADGSVEALAIGPEDRVEALIAWCRQGPPRARVDDVVATEAAIERLTGFEKRPDA